MSNLGCGLTPGKLYKTTCNMCHSRGDIYADTAFMFISYEDSYKGYQFNILVGAKIIKIWNESYYYIFSRCTKL